jgi:hypothetical protein
MGFRFQRRVTLFPGVRLNFSRGGVSASIGPRGASVTVGPRGSTLNLGIPGTGLSFRQQLSGQNGNGVPTPPRLQPETLPPSPSTGPAVEPTLPAGAVAIQSAPVAEVTSDGLAALKALIKEAAAERNALAQSIPVARTELNKAERRLRRAQHWFFGLFIKSKVPERQAAVEAKAAELKAQEERASGAFIDAEFALDESTRAAFSQLCEAFVAVAGCERIWDVTTEVENDRKRTRSSASMSVQRQPVPFSVHEDPVLQTETQVLRLHNANGADLLVYPGFLLMEDHADFALIDLRDIALEFGRIRFIETDPVPSDSQVVDYTWAKCNKDGSPDKRFANNYRIPVAAYGELSIQSATGINERYQFSSVEKSEAFAEQFSDYQTKLRAFAARVPASAPPAATSASPTTLPAQPSNGTQPSTAAPVVAGGLKSLAYIQGANAISPDHVVKVMKQCMKFMHEDVERFNGKKPLSDAERFMNEWAGLPEAARAFFRRAPVPKGSETEYMKSFSEMVRSVVSQCRSSIEQVEPKTEEAKRVLALATEIEAVLAREASGTSR